MTPEEYAIRCADMVHQSLFGSKSECCGAPIKRVKDELLMCLACGNLCCEEDLTGHALHRL